MSLLSDVLTDTAIVAHDHRTMAQARKDLEPQRRAILQQLLPAITDEVSDPMLVDFHKVARAIAFYSVGAPISNVGQRRVSWWHHAAERICNVLNHLAPMIPPDAWRQAEESGIYTPDWTISEIDRLESEAVQAFRQFLHHVLEAAGHEAYRHALIMTRDHINARGEGLLYENSLSSHPSVQTAHSYHAQIQRNEAKRAG